MLKYQEIIEKLKIEQKLSLLADVGALAGVEIPGTALCRGGEYRIRCSKVAFALCDGSDKG